MQPVRPCNRYRRGQRKDREKVNLLVESCRVSPRVLTDRTMVGMAIQNPQLSTAPPLEGPSVAAAMTGSVRLETLHRRSSRSSAKK